MPLVYGSVIASSSHGKPKGSSRLRSIWTLSPCLSLHRSSTSDEAKTACRPEMTACPAFGLSTELPVSSNEETESQRGSGLRKACPWPLGQNLGLLDIQEVGRENAGARTQVGRGATCQALHHVIPVSPNRHATRWRQRCSDFPGEETEADWDVKLGLSNSRPLSSFFLQPPESEVRATAFRFGDSR